MAPRTNGGSSPVSPTDPLKMLHAEVDELAGKLALRHGPRLHCERGCTPCCTDGLTVFEVEADRIRHRHAALLQNDPPHPAGACAFLDHEGACRIYEVRPYVCRTQGLPLRWFGEDERGKTVEYRDICPLNEEGPPLEELSENECWTIGPVEGQLASLQKQKEGDPLKRVALRDLFRRTPRRPGGPENNSNSRQSGE